MVRLPYRKDRPESNRGREVLAARITGRGDLRSPARFLGPASIQGRGEMAKQRGAHFCHRHGPAEAAAHGTHHRGGKTTRVDGGEAFEFGADVEREAVQGYPAAYRHAERGQLVRAGPHPGQPGTPAGLDGELGQGANDGLLKAAQISHQLPLRFLRFPEALSR